MLLGPMLETEPHHPDASAPERSRFVKTRGARIRVHEWGDSAAPAILCCHGFIDHARGFDLLAPILAQDYRVVSMDARGHGESSWADSYVWGPDLGDIIHVLPALKAARTALPDAFIGWLVEESGAPLIEGHPLLDAVHVMPRKAWRSDPLKTLMGPMRDLVGEVRDQNYETAIDFQGLTKSAYWTKLSGAKQRIGFRGEDAREISSVFYNAGNSNS